MILLNSIGLIGDAIGSLPATYALATAHANQNIYCYFAHKQIFGMIPPKYSNIKPIEVLDGPHLDVRQFDLTGAFAYATYNNLHMTQAHFKFLGLPVPSIPIRPELHIIEDQNYTFDYGDIDYAIAPFSRSLPEDQKWPKHKWQQLVDSMPDKKFLLFGDSRHDNRILIHGVNVSYMFDFPLNSVAQQMQKLKSGVISVVTGISHMAHALKVKNYLLECQGSWGVNPDAIRIHAPVHQISVEEVQQLLIKN